MVKWHPYEKEALIEMKRRGIQNKPAAKALGRPTPAVAQMSKRIAANNWKSIGEIAAEIVESYKKKHGVK